MKRENTSLRLRKLMSERNLRQVDILALAQPYCINYDIKMNKSDISQYVSGKVEPSQDKLIILGMALNVNEAWLMGFDVPKERKVTTQYEDIHDLDFLKNIAQDEGYEISSEASTYYGDSFIVRKPGEKKEIILRNHDIKKIIETISKEQTRIFVEAVEEKYRLKQFYSPKSLDEQLDWAFATNGITNVEDAKAYLSLKNHPTLGSNNELSDSAIIEIANIILKNEMEQ